MQELTNLKEMREWSRAERARGRRIGFVPTMGFLHQGHLHLVDRAKQRADRVVMSSFVNPLQFGPTEDLAQYPRDLERDRRLAGERGVDCLFVPEAPPGRGTSPACWSWSPICFTSWRPIPRCSRGRTSSRRCWRRERHKI